MKTETPLWRSMFSARSGGLPLGISARYAARRKNCTPESSVRERCFVDSSPASRASTSVRILASTPCHFLRHAITDECVENLHGKRRPILSVEHEPEGNSQDIDKVNASIHLRALIADLFLIDELLKNEHPHKPDHDTHQVDNPCRYLLRLRVRQRSS